jgi:hypothetical protein
LPIFETKYSKSPFLRFFRGDFKDLFGLRTSSSSEKETDDDTENKTKIVIPKPQKKSPSPRPQQRSTPTPGSPTGALHPACLATCGDRLCASKREEVENWAVDQVYAFVRSIDLCADYANVSISNITCEQ